MLALADAVELGPLFQLVVDMRVTAAQHAPRIRDAGHDSIIMSSVLAIHAEHGNQIEPTIGSRARMALRRSDATIKRF